MGLINELNDSMKEGQPLFVSRLVQPSFGWDTCMGYLSQCVDDDLGGPVSKMNYKLPLADDIDSINPVKEYLEKNIDYHVIGSSLFLSFSTKDNPLYTGAEDSLIWNVIGQGAFALVDEEKEDEEYDYRLVNPGDIIFIPKGVHYKFKPESARAFVLFSLHTKEEEGVN